MESKECRKLRDRLFDLKQENENLPIERFEAERILAKLKADIRQIKRDLLFENSVNIAGGVAGALLPGPAGETGGIGVTAQTAFAIARLEGELAASEKNLFTAEEALREIGRKELSVKDHILRLENTMIGMGCKLP